MGGIVDALLAKKAIYFLIFFFYVISIIHFDSSNSDYDKMMTTVMQWNWLPLICPDCIENKINKHITAIHVVLWS